MQVSLLRDKKIVPVKIFLFQIFTHFNVKKSELKIFPLRGISKALQHF
jgi:hypothetical protein